MIDERLLTQAELARRLCCSVRSVRTWTYNGTFTYGVYHVPSGRHKFVRYKYSEILEQMQEHARQKGRI